MPHISLLSFLAVGLYALVIAACSAAALMAKTRLQPAWHARSWLVLALLFVVLLASRYLGLEESARTSMRSALQENGIYFERRGIQGYIVAGVLLLVPAAAIAFFYRRFRRPRGRRERALMIALVCGAGMAVLVSLRLISLHAIDRILFGPLKLNWFADVGASVAIIIAALVYAWLVRARP